MSAETDESNSIGLERTDALVAELQRRQIAAVGLDILDRSRPWYRRERFAVALSVGLIVVIVSALVGIRQNRVLHADLIHKFDDAAQTRHELHLAHQEILDLERELSSVKASHATLQEEDEAKRAAMWRLGRAISHIDFNLKGECIVWGNQFPVSPREVKLYLRGADAESEVPVMRLTEFSEWSSYRVAFTMTQDQRLSFAKMVQERAGLKNSVLTAKSGILPLKGFMPASGLLGAERAKLSVHVRATIDGGSDSPFGAPPLVSDWLSYTLGVSTADEGGEVKLSRGFQWTNSWLRR